LEKTRSGAEVNSNRKKRRKKTRLKKPAGHGKELAVRLEEKKKIRKRNARSAVLELREHNHGAWRGGARKNSEKIQQGGPLKLV